MKIITSYLRVFILMFLAHLPVTAQQTQNGNAHIAELQKKLEGHADDTGKVQLFTDIANTYNKISPYDGIKYAVLARDLAEYLKWKQGIARANSCLGANYFSLSDYSNAYTYWSNALRINEELGNKIGIANQLHNIGNIYVKQKNYEKALEYYEKALKTSRDAGNKDFATHSYSAIGIVYTQMKNYPRALEYHLNALGIDEERHLKGNIASDQLNLAIVYDQQGNYTKAREMLATALQIKKELGDRVGTAKMYHTIGKVYLDIANHILSAKQDNEGYGTAEHNLQLAVSYLDSSVAVDKEIGQLDNMQQSYEFLSEAHELMHNPVDALNNYRKFVMIKDSVFSAEKQAEIFNLERKAEIEEKEIALEKEEHEKERIELLQIAGISLFIIILIPVVLLLIRKKINQRILDITGTVTILITFEFIQLLIHGKIEQLTHHNLLLTLLCLLLIAGIIIPIHHKIEHWLKKKIGIKKHQH